MGTEREVSPGKRLSLPIFVGVAVALIMVTACSAPSRPSHAATGPLLPTSPTALPQFDPPRFHELLAQLRGKPIVVNIWASWCGPCITEAPDLAQGAREFKGRALDDLKTRFLHAVSHELRTPLTAILGFGLTLQRQLEDLGPSDVRDMVDRMAANARKLDRLLRELLDLDRLDRGIVMLRPEQTDLAALIREIVQETEWLDGHPVHLDLEPLVAGVDTAKVERIMENLLANVARHTPPGTPVWVGIHPVDEGIMLSVEDAGPGVREGVRREIFEPFRQDASGERASPGLGIGLSIVARFAELHGGRAWVEERKDGGAAFKVVLRDDPSNSSPSWDVVSVEDSLAQSLLATRSHP